MGWIRIRMDPELLHGSETRKFQSWIRNTSFQIHNTVFSSLFFYSGSASFNADPDLGGLFKCGSGSKTLKCMYLFKRWLVAGPKVDGLVVDNVIVGGHLGVGPECLARLI